MRSMSDLLKDERFAAALEIARARRQGNAQEAPYTPPDKPLHQWTAAELQEAAERCTVCRGTGYVRPADRQVGFGGLARCPGCQSYHDEQRRRKSLEALTPVIQRYSMLRGELVKATFASYDTTPPGAQAARDAVRSWAGSVYLARGDAAPWLYLHGPNGNGKTHLAAAATNGLTGENIATVFTTYPELLGLVSRNGYQDQESAIAVLQQVPVLIIDDLRAEDLTNDWKLTVLFRILDARYVSRAATLIVSNLPVAGQQREPCIADFEPRIASRLQDRRVCRIFTHTAPDYRKAQH